MNIDVETGLPELPEGFYWRIIEATRRYSDNGLLVQICRNTSYIEDVYEYRELPQSWWDFFKQSPVKKERVKVGEKDVVEINVCASTEMKDEHLTLTPQERKTMLNDGTGWDYSSVRSFRQGATFLVRLWEPTPENILKAATASLEKFNKVQDAQKKTREAIEARKAVIGSYPPKKLGGIDPDPVDSSEVRRKISQYQKKLRDLKTKYESGDYSGHPEEMLGDIDNVEYKINKLLKLL